MAMREDARAGEQMLRQRFAMLVGKGFATCFPCRLRLRPKDLPGKIVAHAANPRDDLVAEQRVVRG